jgi:LPXTG-motif cell wall-anchored protein
LTPIATFITTTPGVLVTTTPFPEAIEEGGDGDGDGDSNGDSSVSGPPPPPSSPGGPIHRLPETGLGGNWLALAGFLGLLMLGTGFTRRIFFNS